MVDWLHCNCCHTQPGRAGGRMFYLTSCGHVYCQNCQEEGFKEKCLKCKTPTPGAVELSAKMKPQYEAYFKDPDKLMKTISSDLQDLTKVLDFQNAHRKRFATHLQQKVEVNEFVEKLNLCDCLDDGEPATV